MCRQCGTKVVPVDIGMAVDTKVATDLKVACGTANMTKGPAMTREQAVQALEAGIGMVRRLKEDGYGLLATGEMGIGNTTTSSAVASVLLNRPVEEMTGRGAGLSGDGLNRKIHAIKKAIEINQPNQEDAIDVLAKVGGFDIAGMAGMFPWRCGIWCPGRDRWIYFLCGSTDRAAYLSADGRLYDRVSCFERTGSASASRSTWQRGSTSWRNVSGRGKRSRGTVPVP